jgi:hypothetical protein
MDERRDEQQNGDADAIAVEIAKRLPVRISDQICAGDGFAHHGRLVIRRRCRAPVFRRTIVASVDLETLADRLVYAAIRTSHHGFGLAHGPPLALQGTRRRHPAQQPPKDTEQNENDQNSHEIEAVRKIAKSITET